MHTRIKPLSPEVIAQIRSTVSINRLSDVILGLLRNSLDSGASKIDVTINFSRGSCSVEDNGIGIPGEEFQEHGNLGQAYCTSKSYATNVYGTDGSFLASLASLSLLNVTSRHENNGSEYTILFHYSKRISDEAAASHSQPLNSLTHGTRVVVRNAFGNMPVRIKQRALLEDQGENRKEWRSLMLLIASLMISWHKPVSLFVLNEQTGQKVAIVDRPARLQDSLSSQTAFNVALVLNILTQTSLVDPGSRLNFDRVSGATSTVTVKGVICSEPSPTKERQFISFGIEPVRRDGQHNELFETVNRIFAKSDFGMIDEDSEVEEAEQVRRNADHRCKTNGKVSKHLRIKKRGIDRWPTFYLRITLENSETLQKASRAIGAETQATLRSVAEVLEAISVQWLTERQFRPQKLKPRPEKVQAEPSVALKDRHPYEFDTLVAKSDHERPWSEHKTGTGAIGVKRRRPQTGSANPNVDTTPSSMPPRSKSAGGRSFNAWSRMKSSASVPCTPAVVPSSKLDVAILEPKSDLQLRNSEDGFVEAHCNTEIIANVAAETLQWQDPVTKEMFLINARSGVVLPKENVSAVPHPISGTLCLAPDSGKRTGTDSFKHSRSEQPSRWLTETLQAWDNPIFRPSEAPMNQINYDLPTIEAKLQSQVHDSCTRPKSSKDPATMDNSTIKPNRLTVSGLRNAITISQVDKKFILVKVPSIPIVKQHGFSEGKNSCNMLALVDQHAADERCKVESLFKEISLPSEAHETPAEGRIPGMLEPSIAILHKPIIFGTTTEESVLIRESIPFFARWGILYDMSNTRHQTDSKDGSMQVKVKALPRAIAERCVGEPHLLIDLIRGEIWNNDRKRTSARRPAYDVTRQGHEWLKEIGRCPQGIIDMLNSRACRSAIMFNDELSKAQCEALVSTLAETAFPFQCAHGRPSMVPLLHIENDESSEGIGLDRIGSDVVHDYHEDGANSSFSEKFKLWQGRSINRPKEDAREVPNIGSEHSAAE